MILFWKNWEVSSEIRYKRGCPHLFNNILMSLPQQTDKKMKSKGLNWKIQVKLYIYKIHYKIHNITILYYNISYTQ